jgi:hypothetical protein
MTGPSRKIRNFFPIHWMLNLGRWPVSATQAGATMLRTTRASPGLLEARMMSARKRHCLTAPVALGLGVVAAAMLSGGTEVNAEAARGPVRCEIKVTSLGGGVELQGVVFADAAIHGDYALQVSSAGSGRSSINQAGRFSAGPDGPAKLGTVRLGGDNGTYRATLKVTWNGEEIECEKTVGGGWL